MRQEVTIFDVNQSVKPDPGIDMLERFKVDDNRLGKYRRASVRCQNGKRRQGKMRPPPGFQQHGVTTRSNSLRL